MNANLISVVILAVAICSSDSTLCQIATAEEQEFPGWGQAMDPDGDCTFHGEDGQLTIVAPGPRHGLSIELNRMNAPRVMRTVEGDFSVELRIDTKFTPGDQTIAQRTAYQGSGLLLFQDDENYARIEAAVLVRNGNPRYYVNFELRVDGQLQRFGIPDDYSWDSTRPIWLRLDRRDNQLLGAATQEVGSWTYLNPKNIGLSEVVQIGVAAINASSLPLQAEFADMRLFVPAKTVSEEQKPAGSVSARSDVSSPACNQRNTFFRERRCRHGWAFR